MTHYIDSSVLVSALVESEATHEACLAVLTARGAATRTHALAETFATLTGGRLGIRVSPATASMLISTLLPKLRVFELSPRDFDAAFAAADKVGARGGAIYDYLHLLAARKISSKELYTLNVSDFAALARSGDPKIVNPGSRRSRPFEIDSN